MDHEPNTSDEGQPLEEHPHASAEGHEAPGGEPQAELGDPRPDEGLEYPGSEESPAWPADVPYDSGDSHRALLDALSKLEENEEPADVAAISGLIAGNEEEIEQPQAEPDEANVSASDAAPAPGEPGGEQVETVGEAIAASEVAPEPAELGWEQLETGGEGFASGLESAQPNAELTEAGAEVVERLALQANAVVPSLEPEREPDELAASFAEPHDANEAEQSAPAWGEHAEDSQENAADYEESANVASEPVAFASADEPAYEGSAFGTDEAESSLVQGNESPGEEVDAEFRALIDALSAEADGEGSGEGAGFDQSQESDDLVRALEDAGAAGDEHAQSAAWPVDEQDVDEDADIEALGRQLHPESGRDSHEADLAAALNDELSFQELEEDAALDEADDLGSGARANASETWFDHNEGASVEITAEELVDRTAQESFDEMLEAFEAAEAAGAVQADRSSHPEHRDLDAQASSDTSDAASSFESADSDDLASTEALAEGQDNVAFAESMESEPEEAEDEGWSLIGATPDFDPSTLEIRRIGPEPGVSDQPVTYGFVVRNTAPVALSRVRVEHVLPSGSRCIGVQPTPEVFINNSKLVWHLGEVEAGAEHCFLVRVERPGGVVLPSEATAVLHACYFLKAPVTRPRLYMKIDAPASARVGEPVVFQLEVKNTGTAPARGLTVHKQLGPGLHHAIGEQIEANVGTLRPGESLHLTLTTTAAQPGRQSNMVTVRSSEGVQATVQAEVLLLQAALAVRASRLVHCLVDQPNEYRIEVRNPGTAPIAQALLIDTLPEELEFRGASDDGQFDKADQSVSWVIGGLKPGEIRSYFVQFQAKLPGDHTHRVLAWSDCGLEATDEAIIVSEIDERQPTRLLDDLLATIDREDEQSWPSSVLGDRPTMLTRAARTAGQQHIVFSMGEVDYAIPVESVVEYGHPLTVTPVPNLPDWLLGVANVHGDIISMVDLRLFMGLERHDYDQDGRMLVVRSKSDDLTVGLIVDRVKGIRVVGQELFTMPASPVEDRLAPFVRGATELQGRLLFLLNLDQLLHSPEMRQFEPV